MTKFQILDDDDNGILRDGERRTIHLMMKDGSPNPALSPVQRAIAATQDATRLFDSAMRKPGFFRPPVTTAAMADAEKVRDDAYAEYSRRQADAWKKGPPPAGSYPEDTSSVDDPCTIDGWPGTLQRIPGHDGWLECVRTNDSNDSNDSRTTHDSRSPQQIRDDMYSAYDSEISQRWRDK